MASLFLTDYASYNESTQFEFGKWVEMEQFTDLQEFNEYVEKHFEKADKESPLEDGSQREEVMFADYEEFPAQFYSESMDSKLVEQLIEFVNMDDESKIQVELHLEANGDVYEAMADFESIIYYEKPEKAWHLFQEINGSELDEEIEEMQRKVNYNGQYLTMDYDAWMHGEFTEYEVDGVSYLIAD